MKPFLFIPLVVFLSAVTTFAKDFVITGPNMREIAHAERPKYPYSARVRKITGSGVVRMKINAAGFVEKAEMSQSTGSPILDNATLDACRRWRFKPGSVIGWARMPVTFTMSRNYVPPASTRSANGWVF